MKFLTLASAVAVASAACPNQCSGHGYCDQNDRCVCFRAPGTKSLYKQAYTGADCSLRVCPYGMSHAEITDVAQELAAVNYGSTNAEVALIPGPIAGSVNKLKAFLNNGWLMERDAGVDIKVVATDATYLTFQYKFDFERTFRTEVKATAGTYLSKATAYPVKSGSGNPSSWKDTGLYIYWDSSTPFTGVNAGDMYYLNVTRNGNEAVDSSDNFKRWDANSAHNLVECSGKGVCDRSSGSCKCSAGYTGDACQRTVCVNDCSGHGICQSQAYFAEDVGGGKAYTGYDADVQVGCKCDEGFRGSDCSMVECPSGVDPMGGDGGAEGRDCSGRGVCDYSSGSCNCFKGYFGERCEEQTNLI